MKASIRTRRPIWTMSLG